MQFDLFLHGVLLLLIITLGIISSIQDLKYHKISNKLNTVMIILGISLNLILVYSQNPNHSDPFHYIEIFINIIVASVLGIVLFNYGFWGGGDAKLMISFSALIPFSFYSGTYIQYFPSSILFLNLIVISSAIFLILSLPRIIKKGLSSMKFGSLDWIDIIVDISSIVSFSWIIRLAILPRNPSVSVPFLSYFLAYLLNISIKKHIKKVMPKGYLLLLYSILLYGRIYIQGLETTLSSLIRVSLYVLLFSTFYVLYFNLFEKTHRELVHIDNTSPRMILAKDFCTKLGKKFSKNHILKSSDIKHLQKETSNKKIIIKETARLAPYIFITILLTLIIKSEIITFILRSFI